MLPFLILYTVLCLLLAGFAARKGRDFWTVLFIGLVITPIAILGSFWIKQKSPFLKQ